jgi:hypothetical protein
MPPKPATGILIEDLVKALQDKAVLEAIGNIFDSKLKELSVQNTKMKEDLRAAYDRIDALETYSKKPDLIITGLPSATYADSASAVNSNELTAESSGATEQVVVDLFNKELGLSVSPQDISAVHRLKQRDTTGPAPIIVRFNSLKARVLVFRARRGLKSYKNTTGRSVYINEHLTKKTAGLFKTARDLVRDGQLHSAWTSGGVLHVKKRNDPSSRPTKISSEAVLLAM